MRSMLFVLFVHLVVQHSLAWRHWKRPRPVCDHVKCEPNCREVSNPKGCPTCLCEIVPECAAPLCDIGCKIQTEFKGPCPGCDCDVDNKGIPDPKKPVCDPVKCTGNCKEAVGDNECPICICDPLCTPPKCEPGCEIETFFDGPCPGCKCTDISDGVKLELKKPMCSPPLCPPGCEIEKDFKGPCPGCKCDRGDKEGDDELELRKPMCSPPLCPPRCEIEKDFVGRCPGCKCEEGIKDKGIVDRDLTKPLCDPVKCIPPCHESLSPSGCPICLCDPLCSPPKCPPGCEIEKNSDEPCPGCKCEKDEVPEMKKDCPLKLECGGSCKIETDDEGCKKCVCKPECSIPLCEPGCFIKNLPGRCPFCFCRKRWSKKN